MTVSERLAVLEGQVLRLERLAAIVPDPAQREAILRDAETIRAMVVSGRLAVARDYPAKPRRRSRR